MMAQPSAADRTTLELIASRDLAPLVVRPAADPPSVVCSAAEMVVEVRSSVMVGAGVEVESGVVEVVGGGATVVIGEDRSGPVAVAL